MSNSTSLRGFVFRSVPVVRDFMHGGLVLAGVLLAIFLTSLAVGNPSAVQSLSSFSSRLQDRFSGRPEAAPVADSPAPAPAVLGADLRAVLDHVARKYRVSATALEPVFVSARVSGRELGLDPLLIIAVIGVESGFNPFAESVMGAQGMMQIIPRFHTDKLPENSDQRVLFEPAVNVAVGARVLKESIRRMGGVTPGLQQFAGAVDDPDQTYSNRVLAEKQRLEAVARRVRSTASLATGASRG